MQFISYGKRHILLYFAVFWKVGWTDTQDIQNLHLDASNDVIMAYQAQGTIFIIEH